MAMSINEVLKAVTMPGVSEEEFMSQMRKQIFTARCQNWSDWLESFFIKAQKFLTAQEYNKILSLQTDDIPKSFVRKVARKNLKKLPSSGSNKPSKPYSKPDYRKGTHSNSVRFSEDSYQRMVAERMAERTERYEQNRLSLEPSMHIQAPDRSWMEQRHSSLYGQAQSQIMPTYDSEFRMQQQRTFMYEQDYQPAMSRFDAGPSRMSERTSEPARMQKSSPDLENLCQIESCLQSFANSGLLQAHLFEQHLPKFLENDDVSGAGKRIGVIRELVSSAYRPTTSLSAAAEQLARKCQVDVNDVTPEQFACMQAFNRALLCKVTVNSISDLLKSPGGLMHWSMLHMLAAHCSPEDLDTIKTIYDPDLSRGEKFQSTLPNDREVPVSSTREHKDSCYYLDYNSLQPTHNTNWESVFQNNEVSFDNGRHDAYLSHNAQSSEGQRMPYSSSLHEKY